MVKFDTLAMNKGKWNGEQLVFEAFMASAISRTLIIAKITFLAVANMFLNKGIVTFGEVGDLKYGDETILTHLLRATCSLTF